MQRKDVEPLAAYFEAVTEDDAYQAPWTWVESCKCAASTMLALLDRAERAEAERDAAFAAGQASVLDNLPDEVDLFRAIRDSGAKKRIDIARAVIRALPIKDKPE